MEFSRQDYWRGLPFPSPGDLPNPGIEPGSSAQQVDSLPSEPPGKTQPITEVENFHSETCHWGVLSFPITAEPDSVENIIRTLSSPAFALKIASREELMTSYWAENKGVKRMRLWTHEFFKNLSAHLRDFIWNQSHLFSGCLWQKCVHEFGHFFFFPPQLCSVARCSCVSEATTSIKLFVGRIIHACVTSFL